MKGELRRGERERERLRAPTRCQWESEREERKRECEKPLPPFAHITSHNKRFFFYAQKKKALHSFLHLFFSPPILTSHPFLASTPSPHHRTHIHTHHHPIDNGRPSRYVSSTALCHTPHQTTPLTNIPSLSLLQLTSS